MKVILFLTMMVFSFLSHAQVLAEKKFIMIRQFKGQDQLSRTLSSSLNKTVVKYLASLPGYQLLLNSSSPPVETLLTIYAVEGIIQRDGNTLSFTFDLLDIKKKVLIKTVKKSDIREEDFIRLVQGALEALFIALKNKNDDEATDNENKKVTTTGGKDKDDSSVVTNSPNNTAIDFKQRIKGLQEGADTAITKKQQGDSNADDSLTQNNSSNSSTGGSFLSSTDIDQLDKKDKSVSRVIKRDFNLEVFYEKRSIDTKSYIQTISDLNILHLQSTGTLWHNEVKDFFVKMNIDLGKPLASELPAPNLFNYGFLSSYQIKSHFLGVGIKKEDLLFFNISEPGGGLTSGTIQATWAQALIEMNPIIKDRKWNFKTQYLSSIASSTGWKPLSKTKSFQGNSISLDIGFPYLFYGLTPRLLYQSTNLSGKGDTTLSVNDTRIALGATYSF
jgi:hypothetical protein